MLEQLNDLAGTQSSAEIKAIMSAPGPAEALVDPTTGTYLSAVKTSSAVLPLSISPVYAGCTATSACAWTNNGASPLGFTGTGQLTINYNKVTKLAAGDHITTFWRTGSTGYYVNVNKTLNFTSAIDFTAITRS